jgi:hypothetical protein
MLLYFAPFAILTLLLVGAAIIRPQLLYEYPYFMGATFAVFILPQAYSLYLNEWGGIYLESTLLMCTLCLLCCWLGYRLRPHPGVMERLNVPIDSGRFLQGGIVLVLIGWYFTLKFGSLAEEELSSQMTGIGTIYLFFGGLIYPGFAICFYSALRSGGFLAWAGTAAAAISPLQAAVFYGRREPTALLLLSLGLSLYFIKGRRPPRLIVLAAIVGGIIAIPLTGEYRKLAADDPLGALKSIDFEEQFADFFDMDAVMELKNATTLIAATQATGGYEFGGGYWNTVVFRFVPAQFVGESLKASLMIGGSRRDMGDFIEDVLGARPPAGSTVTGIGDSFNQFGYLGCLVFAAIAYLFKSLWTAANHVNGTVAQILYIEVTTSAMRTVTHETIDFLPGFLYGLIFIGLIGLYARVQPASAPVLVAPPLPKPSVR